MPDLMTPNVEYSESRVENGNKAEKKLLDRRVLCAGIVIGLVALLFLFGWIMGLIS